MSEYYYKFWSDAVFSGEIDESGNLLPIESGSLKTKLETIFYSPFSKFILPHDNFNEAERELEKLNSKYPKRKLQLIPIKNYEDAFKNLDIIEKYKLRLKDKIIANYKKYHVSVNWILSIAALIVIAFFIVNYLIPVLDRNPVRYSYTNDQIFAYNKYDREVWASERFESINSSSYKNFDRRIILYDITEDENNEIVYLKRSLNDHKTIRSIFITDLLQQNWIYTAPEKYLLYKDSLEIDNLLFDGLINNEAEKSFIYYGRLNNNFAYTIGKIDYKGNLISEYWHSGWLLSVELFDIDSDGINELIAGGCNNKYNCAALAIFNSNLISGQSPETNPLRNNSLGSDKYYILLPKTFMNIAFDKQRNDVKEIKQMQNNILCVVVEEGNDTIPAEIFYYLDSKMNLLNIDIADSYVSQCRRIFGEGSIERIKTTTFSDSLKNSILYWNGNHFVNYPTVNKHYSTVKDSIEKIKDILH